jgi:hypothetical protein
LASRWPSTRTRYSLSIVEFSPTSWRATRPSCVSTSRPVESMSSRPAGASPFRQEGWKTGAPGVRCCVFGWISVTAGVKPGLWLTGDIANGLVQQNRHPALLVRLRLMVKRNHRCRIRTGAEFGDPSPINEDPATGDVLVGIAARAKATLGHQLGNTYTCRCCTARRADGFRRCSSTQRRRRCCDGFTERTRIARSGSCDRPRPGQPVTDRRATASDCSVGQRCGG